MIGVPVRAAIEVNRKPEVSDIAQELAHLIGKPTGKANEVQRQERAEYPPNPMRAPISPGWSAMEIKAGLRRDT